MSVSDGAAVLERLRALPGGVLLLELACCRGDVELVGGATRDLLLGERPSELDVVVDGAAEAFAERIGAIVDGCCAADDGRRCAIERHARFGTAVVSWKRGRIDVATRRAESYAAPGALPDVRPGTPDEDLRRRDFTVNAIAVGLGGAHRGELRAAPQALEDLAARRLRVLHDDSFTDDPTRLLRLARYSARLGFAPEQHTAELAAAAVAGGALATISRARLGAELRLVLVEPDAVATLQGLERIGALAALHPAARLDQALARAALAELPPDGRPEVVLLASLLRGVAASSERGEADATLRALLDELELPAAERDAVVSTALQAPLLAERLARADSASQLHEVAAAAPIEAVALAAALADVGSLPGGGEAARRWLSELRHVRLEIDGEDLLDAGIAAGPDLGRRLQRALHRKLDGELAGGREAELAAALEGEA